MGKKTLKTKAARTRKTQRRKGKGKGTVVRGRPRRKSTRKQRRSGGGPFVRLNPQMLECLYKVGASRSCAACAANFLGVDKPFIDFLIAISKVKPPKKTGLQAGVSFEDHMLPLIRAYENRVLLNTPEKIEGWDSAREPRITMSELEVVELESGDAQSIKAALESKIMSRVPVGFAAVLGYIGNEGGHYVVIARLQNQTDPANSFPVIIDPQNPNFITEVDELQAQLAAMSLAPPGPSTPGPRRSPRTRGRSSPSPTPSPRLQQEECAIQIGWDNVVRFLEKQNTTMFIVYPGGLKLKPQSAVMTPRGRSATPVPENVRRSITAGTPPPGPQLASP